MNHFISESVFQNTEHLRAEFVSAKPFPHLLLRGFLKEGFLRQLLNDFPNFEDRNAMNEFGEVGRKAVIQDIWNISDAYMELDNLVKSPDFLNLMSRITGIDDLIYDPEYIGGGTHENLSGQELQYHVDFNYHPSKKWHRRLNLILFLNEKWQRDWGGNLQLVRDARTASSSPDVEVIPLFGDAILFETSERSWHGFERIGFGSDGGELKRRSIAFYFYSLDRPEDEKVAEHATLYYPRPLPSWAVAGALLDESKICELESNHASTNRWIEYLYERELAWSGETGSLRSIIENLQNELSKTQENLALASESSYVVDINQELVALRNMVDAIERSRSYRIAKLVAIPMRFLRRLIGSNHRLD